MRFRNSLCGLWCVALCLCSCDLILDFAQSQVSVSTTHDGSKAEPVTLSLSVPYSGKVGNDYNTCSSYYSFTSAEAGYYNISLNKDYDDFKLYLYSSSDFENSIDNGYSGLYNVILEADTGYYIEASSVSNYTIKEYVITVSPTVAPFEGTHSSPVSLSLGTPYSGKAGKTNSGEPLSYYSFTSADDGLYQIAITDLSEPDAELYLSLYTLDDYRLFIFSNGDSPPDMGLYPNTIYYFTVLDNSSESFNLTYTLTVKRTGALPCEGSVANPISLSVGDAYNGKVGKNNSHHDVDINKSYYMFTISDSGFYSLGLSNLTSDLDLFLYDLPDFDNYTAHKYHSTVMADLALYSGTTYYLEIENNSQDDLTYAITVSRTGDLPNEGTKSLPIILSSTTPHSGKVGEADEVCYSYYSFTPASSGKYTFTISDVSPSSSSTYNLHLYLCETNDYSTRFYYSYETGYELSYTLSAGTTYYFLVDNDYGSDIDLSYTLSVTKD